MKLILFTVAIMFKCSSFSLSAPTDSLVEASSNRSDEWSPLSHSGSPGLAYVTEDEDLGKTGVVIQFRRSVKSDNTEIEARRRSAIDKGFMRFGRSRNMVRFGRSNPDTLQYDNDVNDDDLEHNDNEVNEPFTMRMRKGNMMRFGRGNMMRFGRGFPTETTDLLSDDVDYNNDASEAYDYIVPPIRRSPDNKYDEHGKKILRLGRSSSEALSDENYDSPYSIDKSNEREKKALEGNVLRFGRSDKGNLLRFGRGENMMRFGRGNMMRFGRGNMMRFGRGNMMRFGKRDKGSSDDEDFTRPIKSGNVMRFGRSEKKNLMRFGKRSSGPKAISTSSRIYCEDNKCVFQEKENRLLENPDNDEKLISIDNPLTNNNNNDNYEQLNSLFGDDSKQQGYGEYIIQKK